ncbi:MAG: DUF6279 family lipoprotein [Clostridia bacterium]
MSRFLRGTALAVIFFLLAGCSTMRLAYDNADAFVRWRATSYLDLHGEAMDELNDRIDAFHAWHRAQVLPQYARLAGEAAARVADGRITPEDIVWGYDSFMAQVRYSLREAAERIAPLLDRLTPEQVRHLEERFRDDNRKFARENMAGSEEDRRSLRFKRTRERLEEWLGRLSDAQLERVRRFADETPLFDELRDRERKRLQAGFLEIVRAREARRRLPEAAANWTRGRDPAYTAASDGFRRAYFALLAELDRGLSGEQRAHLVARLRGFADDFQELAAAR